MALTNVDIQEIEKDINAIQEKYKAILADNNSFIWVMENDDFSAFANDTKFGRETQEQIRQLTRAINESFNSQTNSLIQATKDYLEAIKNVNQLNR